jgi:hypothetical protein
MSNQENIILVIREISVSQPIITPPVKVFQKREIRKPTSMFSIIYNK